MKTREYYHHRTDEMFGNKAPSRATHSGIRITATGFGLAASVLGQLMIALAVNAGGSAIVGISAATAIMVCGIAMVLVGAVNKRNDGLGNSQRDL